MDAQVDEHLGDSITYKIDGVALERTEGDPTVPGFLGLFSDDGALIEGITPQQMRWQLKIAVTWLPPTGPSMRHVITAQRLGMVNHRPGPSTKTEDGRYWIIDLQRAPA